MPEEVRAVGEHQADIDNFAASMRQTIGVLQTFTHHWTGRALAGLQANNALVAWLCEELQRVVGGNIAKELEFFLRQGMPVTPAQTLRHFFELTCGEIPDRAWDAVMNGESRRNNRFLPTYPAHWERFHTVMGNAKLVTPVGGAWYPICVGEGRSSFSPEGFRGVTTRIVPRVELRQVDCTLSGWQSILDSSQDISTGLRNTRVGLSTAVSMIFLEPWEFRPGKWLLFSRESRERDYDPRYFAFSRSEAGDILLQDVSTALQPIAMEDWSCVRAVEEIVPPEILK